MMNRERDDRTAGAALSPEDYNSNVGSKHNGSCSVREAGSSLSDPENQEEGQPQHLGRNLAPSASDPNRRYMLISSTILLLNVMGDQCQRQDHHGINAFPGRKATSNRRPKTQCHGQRPAKSAGKGKRKKSSFRKIKFFNQGGALQ